MISTAYRKRFFYVKSKNAQPARDRTSRVTYVTMVPREGTRRCILVDTLGNAASMTGV